VINKIYDNKLSSKEDNDKDIDKINIPGLEISGYKRLYHTLHNNSKSSAG
jgi:hypothetical protein